MASNTSVINTSHKDLVTCVAFNLYGNRMATSSLDHSVRIGTRNDAGEWETGTVLKSNSPVMKVAWAYPEYGQVLVSGTIDGVVKVYNNNRQCAVLNEASGSIRDLGFCPPELGFKLASISTDGHLRVYECLNPAEPKEWTLSTDIDVFALDRTEEDQPLASSARNNTAFQSDLGCCLSWCNEAWWGERLVVSNGRSGVIRLIHLADHQPWTNFLSIFPANATHSISVSSVAWAPPSGRSFQLIASGSRDGLVRLWKVTPPPLRDEIYSNGLANDAGTMADDHWSYDLLQELHLSDDVNGPSLNDIQLTWNITGTVLSTSCGDGKVRLWRESAGHWKLYSVLSASN